MKRIITPLFAIASLGSYRPPVLSGGAGNVPMSVAIPESVGAAKKPSVD